MKHQVQEIQEKKMKAKTWKDKFCNFENLCNLFLSAVSNVKIRTRNPKIKKIVLKFKN